MFSESRVLVKAGLRNVVSPHTLHLICIIMSLEPGLRPTLKWERETTFLRVSLRAGRGSLSGCTSCTFVWFYHRVGTGGASS